MKIGDLHLSAKKLFVEGSIITLIGVILLFYGLALPKVAFKLVILSLFLGSLTNVFLRFFKKEMVSENALISIFKTVFFGFLLASNTVISLQIYLLAIAVALYQGLLAFINIVTYFLYRKNAIRPRWRYLFDGILLAMVALGTFMSRDGDAELQFKIIGVYLMLLGITNIRDSLFFNKDLTQSQLKRKVRVSLPIVLTALIPATALSKINTFLEEEEATIEEAYNGSKVDEDVDLEVLVHTAPGNLFQAVGHVDICYKGRVISYGSYDVFSEKFFGMIGDGVLFNVDFENYIELCKREGHKSLFSYGIKLTEQQREAVEARIREIESLTLPFEPSPDKLEKTNDYTYPYKLKTEADGHIYKFKSSKFKTYFVLSTNCVLLADSIIGQAGTDILSSKGFITPGTYKDYMDREYERPHSVVVKKTLYS